MTQALPKLNKHTARPRIHCTVHAAIWAVFCKKVGCEGGLHPAGRRGDHVQLAQWRCQPRCALLMRWTSPAHSSTPARQSKPYVWLRSMLQRAVSVCRALSLSEAQDAAQQAYSKAWRPLQGTCSIWAVFYEKVGCEGGLHPAGRQNGHS